MALTPYETGERLQPFVWQEHRSREAVGNVDFDDEEGRTVLTIRVSRNNTGYTVHIIPQGPDEIEIEHFDD